MLKYRLRCNILFRPISVESHSPKPWSEIPGPSTLPIIGAVHHFMPGGKFYNLNGLKLFEEFYDTYGPIVKLEVFGKRPNLFLYDAEAISQVLRGENHTPKRTMFETWIYYRKHYKKDQDPMSVGLITNDLEVWQKVRSTVNPVFLRPKIMEPYKTVLDEIAMNVIERIKLLRDKNNVIKGELQNALNLFTLESIGVITLGCRLNCFDQNLPTGSPVYQLIKICEDIMRTVHELEFQPRGSLWKLYPTPNFKKAMKYFEQIENITKRFIDIAIKELDKEKGDEEKGVLEKLLDINKTVAYTIAADSLVGGLDSTSNSLMGILYMLSVNPEKQQKLREELRTSSGNKLYLKACIKEGMRLMPAGVGNIRVTTKEHNILGYRVPANVPVLLVNQIMNTRDQYFARPKEFIPERWVGGKDDPFRQTHPFAFTPFGFGARSCLGRRIADLEMETLLNRVIQNFEIGWSGPPPKVVQRVLNFVEEPLNFTFKDVK